MSQKKRLIMSLVLVVLGMAIAGNSQARVLSKNEMNSVLGTGCCSGTELSNACSGSGGPCAFCNCSGYYIAAGGSLDKCVPSTTPGQDCSDYPGVTCTYTVFCSPGTSLPNSRCLPNCGNWEGDTCILCTQTPTPNPNVTQTCG